MTTDTEKPTEKLTEQSIAEQIDAALVEVTEAEAALDVVLRELRAGVRAEKIRVSEAVDNAFTRLRNGRLTLSRLRERLTTDKIVSDK